MLIAPKDTIAGLPARQVRDSLRRLSERWTVADFGRELPAAVATRVFAELKRRRWVRRSKLRFGHSLEEYYELTLDGAQFRNAQVGKGIPRAKADQLVKELLERVRQVNEDPYWVYRVKRAIVFGSYLSKKSVIGDVDLVIECESKARNGDERVRLNLERAAEALRAGKVFRNLTEQICWPQLEVEAFLKSGNRWLRFHEPSDGVLRFKTTRKALLYQSLNQPRRGRIPAR